MKINIKEYFFNTVIFLLLFFSENCWNIKIFGEENINSNLYMKISSYFVILLFLISKGYREVLNKNYKFSLIWVLFFLSLTISYFYGSFYKFGQPILSLFKAYFWFIGVLVYFVLRKKYPNVEGAKNILKVLILYGVIASIFSIYCSIAKPDIFLNSDYYNFKRFGLTRVGGFAENSIVLAFILSFLALFEKVSFFKIKYVFVFLITGITIFFVLMSRQIIISLLIIIVIIMAEKIVKRKDVIIYLIPFILFLVAFSPMIKTYYNSFVESIHYTSDTSLDAGSFENRKLAIGYYYKLFEKTNFIGFGWMPTTSDIKSNEISYATNHLSYRLIDLGAFSTLFMFGIFGIIVTVLFVTKGLTLLKNNNNFLAVALKYFLLFKIFSLNYFFYWPLFSVFFGIIAYIIEKMYQEKRSKFTRKRIDIINNKFKIET